MAMLTFAYAIAWAAIVVYAAKLAVGRRRLLRRLHQLEALASSAHEDSPRSLSAA